MLPSYDEVRHIAGTVLSAAAVGCVATAGAATDGAGWRVVETREPPPSEIEDPGVEVDTPEASLERVYMLTGGKAAASAPAFGGVAVPLRLPTTAAALPPDVSDILRRRGIPLDGPAIAPEGLLDAVKPAPDVAPFVGVSASTGTTSCPAPEPCIEAFGELEYCEAVLYPAAEASDVVLL